MAQRRRRATRDKRKGQSNCAESHLHLRLNGTNNHQHYHLPNADTLNLNVVEHELARISLPHTQQCQHIIHTQVIDEDMSSILVESLGIAYAMLTNM